MNAPRLLNWSIGLLTLLGGYVRAWCADQAPALATLFPLLPLGLLIWATIHAGRNLQPATPGISFHERLQSGDFLRVFFLLWGSHNTIAASLPGFYLYSAIAMVLFLFLVVIIVREFKRPHTYKETPPWRAGCLIFICCLLAWERNVFIQHYGVPVIGHFLEGWEYDARYHVMVRRDGSNAENRAVATIHVRRGTEAQDAGEDRFGLPLIESSTKRRIEVRRIHFGGGYVDITFSDHLFSSRDGEHFSAEDRHGGKWFITLLPQPAG
jgi:hypothetical protein